MTAVAARVPMVAGNWKMNTTVTEGVALARAIMERCAAERDVEVALLPPFTHLWPARATRGPGAADGQVEVALLPPFAHLWRVRDVLAAGPVLLGAQDVYWEDAGAFTGEISPAMLAGWCDLVLVGHSERRHLIGETDEETGRKVAAARRHGLLVIVAVGETEAERDAGATAAVVERQLDAVIAAAVDPLRASDWVIAYEPVWAIGTGRTATP